MATCYSGHVCPKEQPHWAASGQRLVSSGCACPLTQHFCSWMHTLEKLYPTRLRRGQEDILCSLSRREQAHNLACTVRHCSKRCPSDDSFGVCGTWGNGNSGNGVRDRRWENDCGPPLMEHLYT